MQGELKRLLSKAATTHRSLATAQQTQKSVDQWGDPWWQLGYLYDEEVLLAKQGQHVIHLLKDYSPTWSRLYFDVYVVSTAVAGEALGELFDTPSVLEIRALDADDHVIAESSDEVRPWIDGLPGRFTVYLNSTSYREEVTLAPLFYIGGYQIGHWFV